MSNDTNIIFNTYPRASSSWGRKLSDIGFPMPSRQDGPISPTKIFMAKEPKLWSPTSLCPSIDRTTKATLAMTMVPDLTPK